MHLRVAIVGCGKMGREHARAALSLGARVVWLCDPDIARAKELSEHCGEGIPAKTVGAIQRSSIDAVIVCTPPSARGPVEQAAIEAGVPFFVEKPIGLTAEHAASTLRALRDKPVIHAVGYMFRYRRSVQWARASVELRNVLGVCAFWSGKVYNRPWWLDAGQSGGPFNEQCTHLVDLLRFLGGDIVEVSTMARPSVEHTGVDDTVAVAVRFASGACGTLFYSCLASDKSIGIEVLTTGGPIRLEGKNLAIAGECGDEPPEDVFRTQMDAFLRAVESGEQVLVHSDFEDAWRTQQLVDTIGRSVRSGKAERVPHA